MENLVKFVEKTGNFKARYVTAEEHEDGIGACAGQNYTKNGVFYTETEALEEIGLELKVSCGKLQAKNEADARQQAIKAAESAGVKAIEIKVSRYGNSNNYNIRTRYVK
jgi:hypothetical protein